MWKIINFWLIVIVYIQFSHSAVTEPAMEYYPCESFSSQTQIKKVSIGPCADGKGCVMPGCCGLISGAQSHMVIIYEASIPIDGNNATTYAYVNELKPTDPSNEFTIPIGTTGIPTFLISYDSEACKYMPCPQNVGYEYDFDTPFTIPTTAITSLTVIGRFGAKIEYNGRVVVCAEVYARFVNKLLVPSLKNTIVGPIAGIP